MIDTVEVVPGLTVEADVTRDQMLLGFERSLREAITREVFTPQRCPPALDEFFKRRG